MTEELFNDLGGNYVPDNDDEEGYQCSVCKTVFDNQISLDRHMRRLHGIKSKNPEGFKCPISNCGKIFAIRNYRRKHIQNVHKVDPDLVLPSWKEEESIGLKSKVAKPEVAKDPVLCILCCYSFYPGDKLNLESNQFQRFAGEILKNGGHPISEQLELLESFSVCPDCLRMTSAALVRKLEVENSELEVERLQKELLEEKRKLGRRLAEYSGEMKKIKEVVSLSDVACLDGYLMKNPLRKKQDNSLVIRLRDGIISAATQLDKHTENQSVNQVLVTEPDLYSDPINIKVDPDLIFPEGQNAGTFGKIENVERFLPENSSDSEGPSSDQEDDHNPCGLSTYAGIDTTNWTDFKKNLLKWAERRSQGVPVDNHFIYHADLDKFTVGGIQVVIHEEAEFIECSQCSFHVIEGTLPDNQSVAEVMEQHIQIEHLSANLEPGPPPGGNLGKKYKCNLCGVEITGRKNFNEHLTQNHDRPFVCPTCGKGFATSKNLRLHLFTHSDERRFVCRKGCGYTFKHSKHIANHERRCGGKMTKHMAVQWRMLMEKQNAQGDDANE